MAYLADGLVGSPPGPAACEASRLVGVLPDRRVLVVSSIYDPDGALTPAGSAMAMKP